MSGATRRWAGFSSRRLDREAAGMRRLSWWVESNVTAVGCASPPSREQLLSLLCNAGPTVSRSRRHLAYQSAGWEGFGYLVVPVLPSTRCLAMHVDAYGKGGVLLAYLSRGRGISASNRANGRARPTPIRALTIYRCSYAIGRGPPEETPCPQP